MSSQPFITHQGGKFVVNPDAVRQLSSLKGPVAVLAVCGRARQGKSWLLNQILTKLTSNKQGAGFQVASTHRPCTKGLWLWGQAIPRTLPSGQKYHLLLVDCEGIDAFDQTLDYSTQVFSLGVLLSSMLIYNQMGNIDESSVDKLSCVCEFAKRIKSKAGAADEQELRALSPSFLWLLRDTYLTLDAGMATPKDYMEEVLRAGGDSSKDQTRASIKDVFPARDCFALIRPLVDEAQLAAMDRTPVNSLRPEFQQGLERLMANVLANATPKQFRGNYITGSALASFAQAFVKVINEGGVPSLSSTWQAVIAAEDRHAMDSAMEAYRAALAPATTPAAAKAPEAVEALESAHKIAMEAGLHTYRQMAMGVSPLQARESEAKLQAAMVSQYEPHRAARIAEADMCARQMLSKQAVSMAELLGKEPLDADALHVQLSHILVDYNKQASGPNKYKLAVEFMVNDVARPVADAAARATKNAKTASQRADAVARELAEANTRLAALQQQVGSSRDDVAQAKSQVAALQAECAREREAAVQVRTQVAKLEVSRESATSDASQMRSRIAQLEGQCDRMQAQLSEAKVDAAAKSAEVSHKAQQLEAALSRERDARTMAEAAQASGQGRENTLREDVNRMMSDLQSAHQQLSSKQQEVAQLHQQLASSSQSTADLHTAVHNLQEERAFLQERIASLQQQAQQAQHAQAQQAQQAQQFVQQQQQQQQEYPEAPEADMQDAEGIETGEEGQRKKRKAVRNTAQTPEQDGAGPSSTGKRTPFSHEKEVAHRPAGKRSLGADEPEAPAPSQSEGLKLPEGKTAERMTVQELKDWLTTYAKAEEEVFTLASKNAKKADFVKLAKEKLAAAGGN